jgi:hypothetical protein
MEKSSIQGFERKIRSRPVHYNIMGDDRKEQLFLSQYNVKGYEAKIDLFYLLRHSRARERNQLFLVSTVQCQRI